MAARRWLGGDFLRTGGNTAPAPWLRPADLLVVLFSVVLAAASLILSARMPPARWVIAADVLLIAAVMALRPGAMPTSSRLSWLRDLYIAPVIYLFYTQACLIAHALHNGRTCDTILIAADRWIFGVDPTLWLAPYSHPLITEVLQLAYTSFYVLLLSLAWDLVRTGKREEFGVYSFGAVYGFALSYLGYWLLPSIGPRFVLHQFSALDSELPGLVLTPYLRAFVNWGGAIPAGASNQLAMAQTFRDVFPSGHAMMTMAVIFWSFKFSSRARWPIAIAGSLLVVSTVYLRYHYVIDVLAAAGLLGFCLASLPSLYQLTQRLLTRRSSIPRRNVESRA